MEEQKVDELKFHRRVDELVCGWSMLQLHSFREDELTSLVDMLGDDFKSQAAKLHGHGVKVGKQLSEMRIKALEEALKSASNNLEHLVNEEDHSSEQSLIRAIIEEIDAALEAKGEG